MPEASSSIPSGLRKTLRWATASLRDLYGPRLKRLILFGSQARGEAKPDSDVDLLVVLEGPVTSLEEAKRTSRVATEAAAYRDTVLSFVHMSAEEFADDRRPLVWSIREEGIDLTGAFLREHDCGAAGKGPPVSQRGRGSDPRRPLARPHTGGILKAVTSALTRHLAPTLAHRTNFVLRQDSVAGCCPTSHSTPQAENAGRIEALCSTLAEQATV